MKKYLLTTAALMIGCTGAAYAADDGTATVNGITLYGQINEGITWLNHAATASDYAGTGIDYLVQKQSNASKFQLANSPMGNSNIGLKGAADVGMGFTGLFNLNTGFNPTTGNISDGLKSITQDNGLATNKQIVGNDSSRAGQAFNGGAYVGISHAEYGTLTLGRQNSLQLDDIGNYDPFAGAYAFALIGFSGTAGGSGRTEDGRWDNSVKYINSFGPVRIGAMYQFPGTIGAAGNGGGGGNDYGYAGDIGIDYAGLSVDATYTVKKDETSAAALSAAQVAALPALGLSPSNSLSITASDNTSYSLQAKYKISAITAYGGYEHIIYANPSTPLAVGNTLIGGYTIGAISNTAFNDNEKVDIVWFGLRYQLTDKLDVAAAYYELFQNSFATGANAGCTNSAVASNCSGTEPVESLVFDYKMSKRFDAFAGVMRSLVTGGVKNGFQNNNVIDPTVGVRFTF